MRGFVLTLKGLEEVLDARASEPYYSDMDASRVMTIQTPRRSLQSVVQKVKSIITVPIVRLEAIKEPFTYES
jgi:hypothetical protein